MGKKGKSGKTDARVPEKRIDPSLASLFESSFGAVKAPPRPTRTLPAHKDKLSEASGEDGSEDASEPEVARSDGDAEDLNPIPEAADKKKRKRKLNDDNDDLEDAYMRRLQDLEEASEKNRKSKKSRSLKPAEGAETAHSGKKKDSDAEEEEEGEEGKEGERSDGSDSDEETPIKHESLVNPQDVELEKSARTIFLGNVPSTAISSKSAYKTLKSHFSTCGKVASIRFRSIAFSEQIPRKAAFVTHKLHEKQQTVNAYVVYSSPSSAQQAIKLNGTVVLDRHIRVDSVAHPAKHDTKRCVFVGNLDFEAQEESLWRHFSSYGKVESVRVVRDAKTNVGKGFAYVQFEDAMAVDQALLFDGKKMANDRKLRVTRAKTIKRNSKPFSSTGDSSSSKTTSKHTPSKKKRKSTTLQPVYVPKADPQKQTLMGRASKLLGKAGAVALKKQSEVFEGLRATAATDSGIKKGGSGKKKGKPRARASARAAAWKAKGREGKK